VSHPERFPALQECEWCSNPATCRVDAQWTVVDFDYALACTDHWADAVVMFDRRRVDGEPVAVLRTTRYADE